MQAAVQPRLICEGRRTPHRYPITYTFTISNRVLHLRRKERISTSWAAAGRVVALILSSQWSSTKRLLAAISKQVRGRNCRRLRSISQQNTEEEEGRSNIIDKNSSIRKTRKLVEKRSSSARVIPLGSSRCRTSTKVRALCCLTQWMVGSKKIDFSVVEQKVEAAEIFINQSVQQ
jgi:hypothetical protein